MKIYDTFSYNGEKDILDIRLAILEPFVDKFVICESRQTFSGKEKPIYYEGDNPKVIHIISPDCETDDPFVRAGHQKDFIRTFLKTTKIQDDDVVYFGDVDEIWEPVHLRLALESKYKVFNLRQLNYSYFLNNKSSEDWVGTVVGKWGEIKTKDFNYWRATHTNILENGGWHFTNMGGADMIRKKLEDYDHQEFNTQSTKVQIEYRIANNQDYVGRIWDWTGKPFTFKVEEENWPQYLKDNREQWKHLLK